jgi:hypothetical protein
MVLGRSNLSDIVIPAPQVSRQHMALHFDGSLASPDAVMRPSAGTKAGGGWISLVSPTTLGGRPRERSLLWGGKMYR